MNWRERYAEAYRKYHSKSNPAAMATGYFKPKFPAVNKANGLTLFIINFLLWSGHRATRVSSAGRYVPGKLFEGGMFIPGSTRKGSADISATIRGRSVMMEVKIGKDKPSAEQLREQALEREAEGVYEFIKTPEDFFTLYDSLTLP